MTNPYTNHGCPDLRTQNTDHILREILIAMAEERDADDLSFGRRSMQLTLQAQYLFAELNGWRFGSYCFRPRDLGKTQNSFDGRYRDWLDHDRYYKAPRRDGKRGGYNVAVVGQPYQHTFEINELKTLVGEGYRLWLPPAPQASFHYPGCCFFLVLTGPEIERIEWLPEQTQPELREMTEDGWENNPMLAKFRQLERMKATQH
jgi:hypothetical protein